MSAEIEKGTTSWVRQHALAIGGAVTGTSLIAAVTALEIHRRRQRVAAEYLDKTSLFHTTLATHRQRVAVHTALTAMAVVKPSGLSVDILPAYDGLDFSRSVLQHGLRRLTAAAILESFESTELLEPLDPPSRFRPKIYVRPAAAFVDALIATPEPWHMVLQTARELDPEFSPEKTAAMLARTDQ